MNPEYNLSNIYFVVVVYRVNYGHNKCKILTQLCANHLLRLRDCTACVYPSSLKTLIPFEAVRVCYYRPFLVKSLEILQLGESSLMSI